MKGKTLGAHICVLSNAYNKKLRARSESTSFSKTTLLQSIEQGMFRERERAVSHDAFKLIKNSPLLVNKCVFMLTISLSNNQ